ncbi:MAG: response regulator [Eudoraea sp.]|nr:response regulator [Eudoraea sp.]NNJ41648.1 response regulator [Eudoraea sp.]
MRMLEQYKQQYLAGNIQFAIVDPNGKVLDCDQHVLPIAPGDSLPDFHPFFECITEISKGAEEEILLNCVHLPGKDSEVIADIHIHRKPEGLLVIIYDLSQHYNNYQAVAQARNESIIKEELIVLKNQELEEREKFKNTFIQNFSHELRNPLGSMLSITNLLGNTPLTSEQRQMIAFLKDSNQNLKLMLEDILSISMIATGRLALDQKVFDFHKFLELIRFTYSAKAEQKGLSFALEIDDKIPERLTGDRLRLYQVLTNLLDNALKYTEEGAIGLRISLNQRRANKVYLRFVVTDTGSGIAPESIPKVFESFSRADAPANVKGTGLGLPIVKGLLALMESEIQLHSSLGKGSEFYFDIALKYPLPSEEAAWLMESPATYTLPPWAKKGKKFKLLIVEDDEGIQTVLFKFLMDTGCFYIDLIYDGARVMEAVIQDQYDLIIMDVDLPNISGKQLTRLIRGLPMDPLKSIPILGLTARAYEQNLAGFRASGMDEVLTKPFENNTLLNTVFTLLK